jgi:hydrogenase maturation protein HypF
MEMARYIIEIEGAVQGVGFRPFVYRTAHELGINGWVANGGEGVIIDAEAREDRLNDFLNVIQRRKPPLSQIKKISINRTTPAHYRSFEIKHSEESGEPKVTVLPDVTTCAECLTEVEDAAARRYRYPFTNCTNCGPRFSIIQSLPYDRPRTTMSKFEMCPHCRGEYTNPLDRRFHAQPIACPECGPRVWLADQEGRELVGESEAIEEAAREVRQGRIVAMKGLGGFLLLCDATNQDIVMELRKRKHREEKPFAVMMSDLSSVKKRCIVSSEEQDLLTSHQRPIVLLRKREILDIAEAVAPNNSFLGVMLPYTPLHYLIMKEVRLPVVATSGNISDEPIAKDNVEALERLRGIADFFLMNNRDIERRIDDSVVRVVGNNVMIIRRARGYSPAHIRVSSLRGRRILALGGHLKNTVAITRGDEVILSQYIGDLDTKPAIQGFREAIDSLRRLYRFKPEAVAVDMHPRYISTQYGLELGLPVIEIQHHHAHVVSCMAEYSLDGSVLGIAWDGVGYGTDGEAWGSEFLMATRESFKRVAHISGFPLPGGEASVRKPFKSALGLLWEIFGDGIRDILKQTKTVEAAPERDIELSMRMMKNGINSPRVYGVGRIFDAVSSLLGVRHICSFEGQAAMELEHLGWKGFVTSDEVGPYNFDAHGNGTRTILLNDVVDGLVNDLHDGVKISSISLKFHLTLAEMIREIVADKIEGRAPVVLSGGVFQNALLTTLARRLLEPEQIQIHTHQVVPPNDGGISLGQAVIADARM